MKKIHKQYLNTLGNLTLTGYNQEMSNSFFQEKKEKGFNRSHFYLNQSLKNLDRFGENELKNRLNSLSSNKSMELFSKFLCAYRKKRMAKYSLADEKDVIKF